MKLVSYHKDYIVVFVFLLNGAIVTAQSPKAINLVVDPGFEILKSKDTTWSIRADLRSVMQYWLSPTETTPDILRRNKESSVVYPRSGKNVGGIFIYMERPENNIVTKSYSYREYLQSPLVDKLKPGKYYTVQLWVSVLPDWKRRCNNIGLFFSVDPINYFSDKPLEVKPQVNFKQLIDASAGKWIPLEARFMATDTFKYLTIGNFFSNEQTQVLETTQGAVQKGCYYLLDEVYVGALEEVGINNESDFKKQLESSGEGSIIHLSEISFLINDYKLLPASFAQLDRLSEYLLSNTGVKILIKGHTDNTGTEGYNILLSSRRAEAVYHYLLQKNVPAARLSFKGFGSSSPIASNATESGRAKNRRVEFEIISK